VLIGFMGAGKTTVGRCVAGRLDVAFTDTDHVIIAEQGRSIQQIFADHGEAAFREIEHEVIKRLLVEQDGVLALGGGAAIHPGTQQLLRAHPLVVHLKVTLEHALERCGDDLSRPILRRPDLAEIHARRMEVYDQVATMIQITDGLDSQLVCGEVLRTVERCSASSATQV
jgi:shikimate kinase